MKLFFPKTAFILGLLIVAFNLNLAGQTISISKSDTVVCDTFPPPRNLDGLSLDMTVMIWWEIPILIDSLGIDTFLLENLYSYKLIRNGIILDTIYHTGEDTIWYYDSPLPGPWGTDYSVSAIYDLANCGLPGEYGESEYEGVLTFSVSPLYLPLIEGWNAGNFGCDWWKREDNWRVNTDYGNPFPTAEYLSNFQDTNYRSAISTWWIDCIYCPCYDTCIDGDYYLEFDFELSANQVSGTEYLTIEYTDSLEWHVIEEFSNSVSYIPWTHQKLNITEWVKGKYVSIAFVAQGENSSKINSWYVDNIKVYRHCHPPHDLHWSIIDEEIRWTSPIPHTQTKNYTGKGLHGYNIYHNDSVVGFTIDTTFTFLTSYGYGPYFVTAVYEDCEPSSNYIYGSVGIQEPQNIPEIKIYPNPCNGQLTIESDEELLNIKIINPGGEIVFEKKLKDKEIEVLSNFLCICYL